VFKLIIILFYFYSRIISNLKENEAKIQTELELQQEFENKTLLLFASYVEHLDEDYLFQQIFSSDKGRFASHTVVHLLLLFTKYNLFKRASSR